MRSIIRYEVVNFRTHQIVRVFGADSAAAARRFADRLDQRYGACTVIARAIYSDARD